MAYGVEAVLGFPFPQAEVVAKALGVEIDLEEHDYGDSSGGFSRYESLLLQAHRAMLEEIGFKDVKEAPDHYHLTAETPAGFRVFSPLRIQVYYDTEVDDEGDAVLGISLSSRYQPTFLDWRRHHGGSSTTILDEDSIRIARKHIEQVLPEFKAAEILAKLCHY